MPAWEPLAPAGQSVAQGGFGHAGASPACPSLTGRLGSRGGFVLAARVRLCRPLGSPWSSLLEQRGGYLGVLVLLASGGGG